MNSLFEMEEVSEKEIKAKKAAKAKEAKIQKALCKGAKNLAEAMPEFGNDETIHFVSNADWSSHDLLFHILRKVGRSEVVAATWSITETPCRMITAEIGNLISEITLILDWRVKVRCPAVLQLAKGSENVNLKLSSCHAKVMLIIPENKDISPIAVVGSANFTNNPRIEAGVITTNKELTEFHEQWMRAEINNEKPLGE